ncbi:transmembrane protein, putative, partial [Bodo saltans]
MIVQASGNLSVISFLSSNMKQCQECLRSVVCLCHIDQHIEKLRVTAASSMLRKLITSICISVFLFLRLHGWLPPIVEVCAVVLLLVDASPLRRRELIIEAFMYVAVLLSVPWLGWRIGCILSRTSVALVTLMLFHRNVVFHLLASLPIVLFSSSRVDGGISMESVIGMLLGVLLVLCWSEFTPLVENRFIKWLRSLAVSEASKWLLVESGFIFAHQVKDNDKDLTPAEAKELGDVDEEFSRVPQHLSCIAVLSFISFQYAVLDAPVTLFAAVVVVLHLITFTIDPSAARWFALRVKYLDGLALSQYFVLGGTTAAHHLERRLPSWDLHRENLTVACIASCIVIAWFAVGGVLWLTPYPATLFMLVDFGMLGWIVPAVLSQKLFSGAFSLMCAVSLMLVFGCA